MIPKFSSYRIHVPGKRQSLLWLIQIETICFLEYATKIPNHNAQITNNIKIQGNTWLFVKISLLCQINPDIWNLDKQKKSKIT